MTEIVRSVTQCLGDVVSEFADGNRVSTGPVRAVLEIRLCNIQCAPYIKVEFMGASQILITMKDKTKYPPKENKVLLTGASKVELAIDIINGSIDNTGQSHIIRCYLVAGASTSPTEIVLRNLGQDFDFRGMQYMYTSMAGIDMEEHIGTATRKLSMMEHNVAMVKL